MPGDAKGPSQVESFDIELHELAPMRAFEQRRFGRASEPGACCNEACHEIGTDGFDRSPESHAGAGEPVLEELTSR